MRSRAGLALTALVLATGASGLSLMEVDQKDLEFTIYDSFAVIRDVRETVLPKGRIQVDFEHLAQTIDPGSVTVRSLKERDGLKVVEQMYQYDLLNKQTLLERYIGSKLKYSRTILQDGTYEKILREGILLSINPEVVRFGDEIEISPEGVISLPYIPEGLRTTPTLLWQMDNDVVGRQAIETSYVADGLSWRADYLVVLGAETFDLNVWVNISNSTGANWRDAGVTLVAGDVRREAAQPVYAKAMQSSMRMEAMDSGVAVRALSEYYAYDMPGRLNIDNNQTRQLRLLQAKAVPFSRSYVLRSGVMMHQAPEPETSQFDIELSFVNREKDNMGAPLPAGRVRVFNSSADHGLELLGEDSIRHTPVDEKVTLVIGKAFDLVAERRQKDWRRLDERSAEISYEINLRNRKQEAVTLVVQETLYGDWTVTAESEPGKRINSTTLEFRVQLAAGATKNLTYKVRTLF